MTLYGSDLLKQIYAAYLERYQKALARGYDAEGERYHWLYNELLCRVQRLKEALLYMEALPHFLNGTDEDHALQYIMGYRSCAAIHYGIYLQAVSPGEHRLL